MSLIDARTITEDDRQKIIIEFIRSKPYCNAEDIVQGVKNDISRVTVFKMLHKLSENGVVQRYLENNQKRNAREHKLFVNEGNPLVSVRLELEKFESAYFPLLNRVMKESEPERILAAVKVKAIEYDPASYKLDPEASRLVKQLLDEIKLDSQTSRLVKPLLDISFKLGEQQGELIRHLLAIFYSMVDACLFRFLFIWSQKITDQHVLQQLYSMVFSKIADMQTRLSESLKSSQVKEINKEMELFILGRFRGSKGSKSILRYLDSFKKLRMEKEIEPVIDALWRIIGDLQPTVYPEPKLYGWPFKYGEDDWRKLVRLLKQHPESSPYGPDKS
jgi:hypothetical protein